MNDRVPQLSAAAGSGGRRASSMAEARRAAVETTAGRRPVIAGVGEDEVGGRRGVLARLAWVRMTCLTKLPIGCENLGGDEEESSLGVHFDSGIYF